MADTLKLSFDYQPLDCIPWQRAITLWYEGKVEILESYSDRQVKSPSTTMNVPCIVRVTRPSRRRSQNVRYSHDVLFIRDGEKCAYCGRKLQYEETTVDHVIPRRLGGQTRFENVVIACHDCNQKKGGKTPEQARMPLLVKPHRPKPGSIRPRRFRWRDGMPEHWKPYFGN